MIHQLQHYNSGPDRAPLQHQAHDPALDAAAHEAQVSHRAGRMTTAEKLAIAHEAGLARARWAYCHSYVTGHRTISCRVPNAHTRRLGGLHSWDYAKLARVSAKTALAHLRELVAAGHLTEEARRSTTCRFYLPDAVADEFGKVCIAELVAEGLPFDDDWVRERNAARGGA